MGKSGRSDGPFAPGRRPVAARGRRAGRGCAKTETRRSYAMPYYTAWPKRVSTLIIACGRPKGGPFQAGSRAFFGGIWRRLQWRRGAPAVGAAGRGRAEAVEIGRKRRQPCPGRNSYDLSTILFDSTGGRDLGRAGRTREALMATSFGGPAGGPGWGAAGRSGAGQWGLSSKREEKLYR